MSILSPHPSRYNRWLYQDLFTDPDPLVSNHGLASLLEDIIAIEIEVEVWKRYRILLEVSFLTCEACGGSGYEPFHYKRGMPRCRTCWGSGAIRL